MFDMIGLPTESITIPTLHLSDNVALLPPETLIAHATVLDTLWVRLLSFIMGAACGASMKGLVGHHAYSILDVQELQDVVVGRQTTILDFFGGKKSVEVIPIQFFIDLH